MDLIEDLFDAAAAGDGKALTCLLKRQPTLVNVPDHRGMTVLHHAARAGSAACVKCCLRVMRKQPNMDLPTELNRTNFKGQDTLAMAAASGILDCVTLLIDAGVNTDYSSQHQVPPLEEALQGRNPLLTKYLLEHIKFDYSKITEMDKSFWRMSHGSNLYLTMKHYRILKSIGVPYSYCDFHDTLEKITSEKPDILGKEAFIIYFCRDAVQRWMLQLPPVMGGMIDITQYCLSCVVSHTQSMYIVNQLREIGVFFPPTRIRGWTIIFGEWGTFRCPCMTDEVQQRLLYGLAGLTRDEPTRPIVDDEQMLTSILYLAVLAIRFPKHDWLSYWRHLCRMARIPWTCHTFQGLLETYIGGSYLQGFWNNIFALGICRTLASVQYSSYSASYIKAAFEKLMNYAIGHVPTLHPKLLTDFNLNLGTWIFCLWNRFDNSNDSVEHTFFINFCRVYLFPWLPSNSSSTVDFAGIPLSAVFNLFYCTNFLEAFLDFSPPLVLGLIRFYSHKMTFESLLSAGIDENKVETLRYVSILAHIESPGNSSKGGDVTEPIHRKWLTAPEYNKEYVDLNNPPFSLFRMAKCQVRICLRMHIDHLDVYPNVPLSQIVDQLLIPPGLKEVVIEPYL